MPGLSKLYQLYKLYKFLISMLNIYINLIRKQPKRTLPLYIYFTEQGQNRPRTKQTGDKTDRETKQTRDKTDRGQNRPWTKQTAGIKELLSRFL